jgi:hypothetical protein
MPKKSLAGRSSFGPGGLVVLLAAAMLATTSTGSPLVAHAADGTCASLTAPAYQRVNPTTKSSLVTTSAGEAADAAGDGYTTNQGTPFGVSATSDDGLRPVHNLYRSATGDHLYTISASEVESATSRGNYVDLGVSFYATTAAEGCGIPVYRVRGFNQHRLVVGSSNRDALLSVGWRDEGTAFYAAAPAPAAVPPPSPVTDPTFSFAVMPDTQQEVLRASDRRFRNRTEWLARNEAALDLRFVSHSGDVVNWDTPDHDQYEVASDAMRPLEDADIPYSLAVGNHDTAAVCEGGSACETSRTPVLFRDTRTFNEYFTAARFGNVGGVFESGKVDNSYSTFNAGGAKWMVLVLEMWPRPAAVEWAKDVVASHPTHNVIVVTHSYLNAEGGFASVSKSSLRTTPQDLFDNLIKRYANIKLVFSGHEGTIADRVDTGVNGNKIYSFLECLHDARTNPVRLVSVDTRAATLKTWVYSPHTSATYPDSTINISGLELVR